MLEMLVVVCIVVILCIKVVFVIVEVVILLIVVIYVIDVWLRICDFVFVYICVDVVIMID